MSRWRRVARCSVDQRTDRSVPFMSVLSRTSTSLNTKLLDSPYIFQHRLFSNVRISYFIIGLVVLLLSEMV